MFLDNLGDGDMTNCLCCAKGIPFAEKKSCPLCGHSLMGRGWWGVDFHWKIRHELELPFDTFWTGLCELHRNNHLEILGSVTMGANGEYALRDRSSSTMQSTM